MKFFIALFALAAVAVAEPEADPAVFYSGLGYNYAPYAAHAYAAHTYAPYSYGYRHFSPYFGNYYNNYFGYSRLFKRDAEADPAVFYSGLGYNFAPYAHHAAAYATPYAYNHYAYAAPYAYNHLAYAHHAYAAPATHVTQVSEGGVSSTAAIHSGNRAFGGYANAGNYVANSAGVVHVAKREAEADPAYFYSNLGYNYAPYAHSAYAHTYAHAPYAYGYRAYSPFYNYRFGYRHFGYHF